MKRVLIGAGVGVVVLAGAAVVIPSMMDWSKYKQQILDAAYDATGYTIAIDGKIGARLLPVPSLYIDNVSVRLPDQAPADHLATFDRLSVSVSLLPLLSKQIVVNDIDIRKPDIRIAMNGDGTYNFMTPRLQKITGMNQAGQAADTGAAVPVEQSSTANTNPMNVEIKGLSIRDGHIVFDDKKLGQTHTIRDLNTSASMGSMQGPYVLMGRGAYNDVQLTWRGNVDKISGDDTRMNIQMAAPDYGVEVRFDGAFSPSAGGSAQGQLDIQARKWVGFVAALTGQQIAAPDKPIALHGLLSATPKNIVLDNTQFSYSDLTLSGVVKARMADEQIKKPLIYARLENKDVLDARKLMAANAPVTKNDKGAKTPAASPQKSSGAIAAPSLKVELPVDLDVQIKSPGVQMAREPLKDVAVTVVTDHDSLRGSIKVGALPGTGSFTAAIYPGTDNVVMMDTQLNAMDVAKFLQDGLGVAVPAGVPADKLRDLDLKTDLMVTAGGIEAKTGVLKWSGGDLSFGGSGYSTKGARPLATLILGSQHLNVDALMGTNPTAPAAVTDKSSNAATPSNLKKTVQDSVKNLSLPMDLDVALSFGAFTAGGMNMTDVEANGKWMSDKLMIDNLSVGAVDGLSLAARGTIASLRDLSGIDIKLDATTKDAKAVAAKYKIALPSDDIAAVKVAAAYKGSLENGDVTVGATVSNVTFGVAGPVADPLGTPQMNNVKVKITSPQSANLLKLVQPGFNVTQPLQGAMDISADTTITGKTYALKNLNGVMGSMSVKGDITADMNGAVPKISGGLNLGDVPLDALMGVSRTGVAASSSSTTAAPAGVSAKWSTEAINTDWMRSMNMDFMIAAKSITYNMWVLGTPSMSISMNNGALTVKDAKAGIFGGNMTANAELKSTAAGAPLSVAATGDMNGVNARSLSNALMNRAINKLDGTVGFDFNITAAGTSPNALVNSLSGKASSNGKDVRVNGIDVAKLATWLRTDLKPSTTVDGLMGSFMGTGGTTFDTHTGAYTITNGQVTFNTFNFDGASALLTTTGGLNIPNWTVDTKTTLKVKDPANVPEMSFTFKGSLNNPVQSMTGSLFENFLKSKIQDQATKLIDKKLGGKLNELGLGGLLGTTATTPAAAAPAPTPVDGAVVPNAASSGVSATPDVPPPDTTTPAAAPKPEDVLLDVLKGIGR